MILFLYELASAAFVLPSAYPAAVSTTADAMPISTTPTSSTRLALKETMMREQTDDDATSRGGGDGSTSVLDVQEYDKFSLLLLCTDICIVRYDDTSGRLEII